MSHTHERSHSASPDPLTVMPPGYRAHVDSPSSTESPASPVSSVGADEPSHKRPHQQYTRPASRAASPPSHGAVNSEAVLQAKAEVDALRKTIEMLERARVDERKHTKALEAQIHALQHQLATQHTPTALAAPPQSPSTSAPSLSQHISSSASSSAAPAQLQSSPVTKREEDIHSVSGGSHEPTQSANPPGRSSCHRCKSTKDNQQLMFCTYHSDDPKQRKKECKKKYCQLCLKRSYAKDTGSSSSSSSSASGAETNVAASKSNPHAPGVLGEDYEWWTPNHRLGWLCPACLGCCKCAACQRKYAWDQLAQTQPDAVPLGASDDVMHAQLVEALQHQAKERMKQLVESGALSNDGKDQPITVKAERKRQSVNSSQHVGAQHAGLPELPSGNISPGPSPTRSLPSSSSASPLPVSTLLNHAAAQQTLNLLQALQSTPSLGDASIEALKSTLQSQLQSYLSQHQDEQSLPSQSPVPVLTHYNDRDHPHSAGHHTSAGHDSEPGSESEYGHHQSHSQYYYQQQQSHQHHLQYANHHGYAGSHGHGHGHHPHGPPGLFSPPASVAHQHEQYTYQSPHQPVSAVLPNSENHRRERSRKRSSGGHHDVYASQHQHQHQHPQLVSAQPVYYQSQSPPQPSPPHSHSHGPSQVASHYHNHQPHAQTVPAAVPQQHHAQRASSNGANVPPQHTAPAQSPSQQQQQRALTPVQRDQHQQFLHNIRDTLLRNKPQSQPPPTHHQHHPQQQAINALPYSPSTYDNYGAIPAYTYDNPSRSNTTTSLPSLPPFSPVPGYSGYDYREASSADDAGSVNTNHHGGINEWPASPPALLSEENDAMPMLNADSIGGSGHGPGLGLGLGVDDMQLSTLSLGAPPIVQSLALTSDTFLPPNP